MVAKAGCQIPIERVMGMELSRYEVYVVVGGVLEEVEEHYLYDDAAARIDELVAEFEGCGDVVETYELYLYDVHKKQVLDYRSAWD